MERQYRSYNNDIVIYIILGIELFLCVVGSAVAGCSLPHRMREKKRERERESSGIIGAAVARMRFFSAFA